MNKYPHNKVIVDGVASRTHPLYRAWKGMRERCQYPKHKDFALYGGRGITVCERWNSFPNFVNDMGSRPEGHTLDRIDPNGPYSKENCRWATVDLQRKNQRPRTVGFTKGAYKNNATGESGIYLLSNGKYRVQLWRGNSAISLGCFADLESAKAAKANHLIMEAMKK